MGLTAVLTRAAAVRPHVLLVTTPGGTAVRLAAERELRQRGWPLAAGPADSDVLLVAGVHGWSPESALERLWRDMPRPRDRLRIAATDQVAAALDAARDRLASADEQRADSSSAAPATGHGDGPSSDGDAPHAHGGLDHHGRAGHEDHHGGAGRDNAGGDGRGHPQHGDHPGHGAHGAHGDHRGHGGHGGGETEMPGGLPLAGQGPDRDGLRLDRLHVPLGPFLVDWPAGLTIRLLLQGDVIQQALLDESIPAPRTSAAKPFWAEPWWRAAAGERVGRGEAGRRRAAAHLDSLGRLLAVAGWPAEAVTARRLRDDLLADAPVRVILPRAERFARRVGGSRALFWLTRDLGAVTGPEALAAGVSGPAARAGGDVPARYRVWLSDVLRDVRRLDETTPLDPRSEDSPRGRWDDRRPPSAALAQLLPRLLTGAELAAARLIVASLDPDLDELPDPTTAVAGG